MNFNQYGIYSAVSENIDKTEQELKKILEQVSAFKEINEIEEAKAYVKELWGVEADAENYALCEKCYLNVIDTEKTYCVNLVYQNKDITYYYEK